jgi:hypothetical protein
LQFKFVVSIHLFSESLFFRYQKPVDEAEKWACFEPVRPINRGADGCSGFALCYVPSFIAIAPSEHL